MPNSLRQSFYRSPLYPPYFRAVRAAQRWRDRARWRQAVRRLTRPGDPPVPPPELIVLVAGNPDLDWFLSAGRKGAESIEALLRQNGLDLAQMGAVLDFGCGVGRVLRHWHGLRGPRLHGSDYNPALVAWCQRHLRFAEFGVNPLHGALRYPTGTFDLIYALSVFTHLTFEQQDFWMAELGRVLRPGGHLLISTHGEFYFNQIPAELQPDFRAGRRVVCGDEHAGSNLCSAFHPPASVRAELAAGYAAVDFVPEGALGNPRQDYWLLRKQ